MQTHRFPARSTSFVGREHELVELATLVPATRLVTLAGPGGAGKTRLACAVSERITDRFADGAWFVDLAPVTDPALVWTVVGAALDVVSAAADVRESLIAALRTSGRLVLLDNCEHLISACAEVVTDLLTACPDVTVLATSREPLGVAGEVLWSVPALRIPPRSSDLDALAAYDSVRLFADRAATADRRFALTPANADGVVRVVERLDGMPLALELAATWTRALTPEEIASRLDDRFRLLTRAPSDAPARHRTLRAVIDWSYELLPEPHRPVLGALSVFRGGFTLDGAEAVCSDEHIAAGDVLDALHDLVQSNLVVADTSGETSRYSMLETIREYADETLPDDRRRAIRDRHLSWYRSFAERGDAALSGDGDELWHLRFDEDHDNIRQALGWSLEGGSIKDGLELAGATAGYWVLRSSLVEGRSWLERLIDTAQNAEDRSLHTPDDLRTALANAHHVHGRMAFSLGDYGTARAAMGRAAELLHGVDPTEATSKLHATVLEGLAQLSITDGRLDDAADQCRRAIALVRSIGDRLNEARILTVLGEVRMKQGDTDGGRAVIEEAKQISREVGDPVWVANATIVLGNGLVAARDLAGAKQAFEEALALCREVGAFGGVAYSMHKLGTIAAERGDLSTALALTQKALDQYLDLGLAELASDMSLWDGLFALRAGSPQRSAASYLRAIDLAADRVGPWALEGLAEVATTIGRAADAGILLGAAAVVREATARPPDDVDLEMIARATALATERDGQEVFERSLSTGRVTSFAEAVQTARNFASDLRDHDEYAGAGPSLVREGEVWIVSYEERTVRVRDTKGMGHIATLVASPGRDIHVLDLVAGAAARPAHTPGAGPSASDASHSSARGGDAGEMLDDEARAAYEQRLRELQEEIDEAETFGDEGRATRSRAEFDALVDELKRATGLGGRSRRAASDSERARLNVQRTVKAAIQRLFEADRALGRHLDSAIATGTYCSYDPGRAPDPSR